MTTEALSAIAARHEPCPAPGHEAPICHWCNHLAPCDARQALDELAALRSQRDLLAAGLLENYIYADRQGQDALSDVIALARSLVVS